MNGSLSLLASVFAGGFGCFALVAGIAILFRPALGKRFFGGWHTLRLNLGRVAVTTAMLASSWSTESTVLLAAACVFATATVIFGAMTVWGRGRELVQAHLVDSTRGMRTYVACVILPMGMLLVAGTIFV